MRMWLGTPNQAQAVTGITRNQTHPRASYILLCVPECHGSTEGGCVWPHGSRALRVRFPRHPWGGLDGEQLWLGTADMIRVGVCSQ